MRRKNRAALWWAAAAVAVLAAVLLVLALIARGRSGEGGGEETAYRYTLLPTEDGVRVELRGVCPKDACWTVGGAGEITRTAERRQSRRRAVFEITADGHGEETVELSLTRQEQRFSARLAVLRIELYIAPDGALEVTGHRMSETPPESGEAEGFRYEIFREAEGGLAVVLTRADACVWTAGCDTGAVSVRMEDGAAETVQVCRVDHAALGSGCVELWNDADEAHLCVYTATNQYGEVVPTGHELTAARYTGADALLERTFGAPGLPTEIAAEAADWVPWVSLLDGVTTYSVGFMSLNDGEQSYSVYFSDTVPTEEFDAVGGTARECRTVTWSGTEVRLYLNETGGDAVWSNGWMSFLLRSADAPSGALAECARRLIEE